MKRPFDEKALHQKNLLTDVFQVYPEENIFSLPEFQQLINSEKYC